MLCMHGTPSPAHAHCCAQLCTCFTCAKALCHDTWGQTARGQKPGDLSSFNTDSLEVLVPLTVWTQSLIYLARDKLPSDQVYNPKGSSWEIHHWCRSVKAKTGQVLQSGEGLVLGPGAPAFTPVPDTDFDPVHIVQWEHDIVWDQQDESPDVPVGAAPLAEDDWAEFDRELGYGSIATQRKLQARNTCRAAVLEALPHRPAKGNLPCVPGSP